MTLHPKSVLRFEAELARLRESGRAFAVATIVRTVNATSAKPGSKALLDSEGRILEGWIGGGCARGAVGRAAREALLTGAPQFVSLRPEDLLGAEGVSPGEERDGVRFARNGCPSRGSMDIFVEPVLPVPRLVVMGRSPVAQALLELAERFDLHRVHSAPAPGGEAPLPAEESIKGFDLEAGPEPVRFVVVATQGQGDEAALRAALASGAGYIAFVGSRRKFATLSQRLRAGGADAVALAAVRAPAGLDIHAITPEEIALSILAEIVATLRAGRREAADGRA